MKRGRARFSAADVLRARLFIVSYSPLWLIFGVRAMPAHLTVSLTARPAIVAWLWCALASFGVVDGWRLTRGARRKGPTVQRFTDVRDQGATVAGYLATYLLPMIGLSVNGLRDIISYLIYFIVALVVFVRSDLALVNPTLYLLGWRVVAGRVTASDDASQSVEVLIMCRDVAALRVPVSATRLAGCFVVVERTEAQ